MIVLTVSLPILAGLLATIMNEMGVRFADQPEFVIPLLSVAALGPYLVIRSWLWIREGFSNDKTTREYQFVASIRDFILDLIIKLLEEITGKRLEHMLAEIEDKDSTTRRRSVADT